MARFTTSRGSEARSRRRVTTSEPRAILEVILNLYREYGLACFDELRGEFAFILYDKAKRLLIAARDRFGIKPLYFCRLIGSGFAFASEMKAIFASGLVAPKLNVAALIRWSSKSRQCAFPVRGYRARSPASFLTIDVDTHDVEISRYWSDEIPAHCADVFPSRSVMLPNTAPDWFCANWKRPCGFACEPMCPSGCI